MMLQKVKFSLMELMLEAKQHDLRELIGVVPQKGVLLGTLASIFNMVHVMQVMKI